MDPTNHHRHNHRPLNLTHADTVPPAANNSPATGSAVVDWLPEFGGYSWVAYGAASLLVVSHFPSPLSPHLSRVGPIFRQVFPLSDAEDAAGDGDVSAVAWCLSTPSSGDLAAAVDRCVFVFQYDSSAGSFCWSQTALLVQFAKVEAISWTNSGDGIISAGTEVVFWKRNVKSWEIAWKFRTSVPQTLVSATWSLEGPSASSLYPTKLHDSGLGSTNCSASNCVNVYHSDGKSGWVSAELWHPQPVFAIQWRPSGGSQSNKAALYAPRHVLLTSCVDGTVRFWSEVDGSRIRKGIKDSHDTSTSRRSFCVVAVIEMNHQLNGTLGTNIFMNWALDLEGLVSVGDEQVFCTERHQNDEVGRCEWLIGFGPGNLLTCWAVHCLDDIATMRSPRVTLWSRHELLKSAGKQSFGSNHGKLTEGSQLNKAVIYRSRHFGPPAICSLVQISACNSLCWSVLYNQSVEQMEGKDSLICETGDKLTCQSGGIMNTFGHTGKILQVVVHPFLCEVHIAVSLDSNGALIFWSTTSSSNSIAGLPSFTPSWQLIGKMILQGYASQEMSLNWAPLSLGQDLVLLIAHIQGIDVYIVNITEMKGQDTICNNKLCTIPFVGQDYLNGPDKIASFPLNSGYKASSDVHNFFLLCVWLKSFRAESWKVALHCYDSCESSCPCNAGVNMDAECRMWVYKTDFAGKRYCLTVNLCSSYFPNGCDEVASMSVVSPSSLTSSLQKMSGEVGGSHPNNCSYHIITGHIDGSSRFWRIKMSEGLESRMPFELVGMISSLSGPVINVSVADWGQKIATISSTDHANMLCIWEPQHLAGGGTFDLEDKIVLNGEVLALRWFVIENMLFLGVCYENELHIYSRKVYSAVTAASETQIWVCIAIVRNSTAIRDFLIGPNGVIVVLHVKHFSLYSPWSFLTGNKHVSNDHATLNKALSLPNEVDRDNSASCSRKIYLCEELSSEENNEGSMFCLPLTKTSCPVESEIQPAVTLQNANNLLKMTDVAEKIGGPLPFYHPEVLLMNIYSGNWKRANVSVSHLTECLASNSTYEQRPNPAKSSNTVRQVNLSNYIEGKMPNDRTSQVFHWSQDLNATTWSPNSESGMMQFAAGDATNGMFPASESNSKSSRFHEVLEKLHGQEALTDPQKMQMVAIVDLIREINNSQYASAYKSLDETGRRFWCAIRLQQLEFQIRCGRKPSVDELIVDSQLIAWAFHSDCHMNLFDTILPSEPTWEEMRKIGVGFWFTNLTDLRTKMEKLARCQYLRKKDPKACALLYIALNRVQVLTGLCKISKDEKDKPLVAFLSRNFQEEQHKAAASKNAYVLMGRHQFELAAAFFLLGGDIISAITVCAKNLGDPQLALVICRIVEGQSGPSEGHLIAKILLPSAIEKRDYWLASILEWTLGNYLQSFLIVLGLEEHSNGIEPENLKHPAFLDPSIGQYCLVLTAKNSLKNALGELNTAVLCQWAIVTTACAFNRCGLPLEALESLSGSTGSIAGPDNRTIHEKSEILPRIFRPSLADSSRWLSHEVSSCLVYQIKLDLATQYIAKLIREHPGWHGDSLASTEARSLSLDHVMSQHNGLLKCFEEKLDSAFACLEQKFDLMRNLLLNKVFVSLVNSKQLHIGYHLLRDSVSQAHFTTRSCAISSSSQLLKHLVVDAEKLSYLLSRFVTAGSIASLHLLASPEDSLNSYHYAEFFMEGVGSSFSSLTAALMMFCNGHNEELIGQFLTTLDLCKCCMYLTSALLQRNQQALAAMLQPILVFCTDGTHREIDTTSMKSILGKVLEALSLKASDSSIFTDTLVTQRVSHGNGGDIDIMIPEDEKCMIFGASLWKHMSKFITCQLNQLLNNFNCNSMADTSQASNVRTEADNDGFVEHVRQVMRILIDAMGNTVRHISFHTAMQLALFFWHKTGGENSIPTLLRLKEFNLSKFGGFAEHPVESSGSSELLTKICDDPKTISEVLSQLPINLTEFTNWNPVRGWNQFHIGLLGEHERLECDKQEGLFVSSPRDGKDKAPSIISEHGHNLLDSDIKGRAHTKGLTPFYSPKEIHKRNGELLEALCINSIEQRQAVVASNKKGIIFFDWGDELPPRTSSEYVWAEADWPKKGWAGTECTPVPTCVSPGVGLGISNGSHLGLGGATVGIVSQVRLGKGSSGDGAFGIPDYTGIGATGMGWGIQDDFDKSVDPPATLHNIDARALACHPSRPYFLAGSSNTHVYLWEFGNEKATATYGVLPAANVPPPYALATIAALQFDCSGHRFANCASDGTVCTWQLEVGGRSNVRPTDSSICFNGHASDVCYVATSGSIIASAGYSSNGVNVVIWDTLAPPTSSRASVMCHEGGACSISVFDNDVGTGSISPMIVTGGKGGDVGLHDFRYIATGKTKRHKHSNTLERATDTAAIDVHPSSSVGDQNRHGMLWYIPKAHSGSVTKISTIPNTSFFLTGGKDGDVKLWDAKRACLVYHWPKLHERHTFLQRSSSSFGGVTRVGVTDIQVISNGFVTCGGDGSVKLVELNNFSF
ncbi:hypothetical protein vseg_019085 [Gypsophila vaccaria]